VDLISVGALTHSAPVLDLGLDWEHGAAGAGGAGGGPAGGAAGDDGEGG
jgi:hypothetical protein